MRKPVERVEVFLLADVGSKNRASSGQSGFTVRGRALEGFDNKLQQIVLRARAEHGSSDGCKRGSITIMTDRRRINGPQGGTVPPIFASLLADNDESRLERPARTRQPNELRKICMHISTPSSN